MQWVVDQTVWIKMKRRPQLIEGKITKVGYKWAYIGRDRFDIDSGQIDGKNYDSPGMVYASQDDYYTALYQDKLFSEFDRVFRTMRARNFTKDQLWAAAVALDITDIITVGGYDEWLRDQIGSVPDSY